MSQGTGLRQSQECGTKQCQRRSGLVQPHNPDRDFFSYEPKQSQDILRKLAFLFPRTI